jgi:heat shock protein HtpX
LSAAELEAVFAHELAHFEGAHGLVGTLAFGLVRTVAAAGFVVFLPATLPLTGLARGAAWTRGRPRDWAPSGFGRLRAWFDRAALVVLFGLTLAALANSRRREYAADDRAVEVGCDPLALARALVKLDRAADPRLSALSPLYTHAGRDDEGGWRRLVATYPPIRDRVARLVERTDAEERSGLGSRERRIGID